MQQTPKISRTKLPLLLETLQKAFGMVERTRIFKKKRKAG